MKISVGYMLWISAGLVAAAGLIYVGLSQADALKASSKNAPFALAGDVAQKFSTFTTTDAEKPVEVGRSSQNVPITATRHGKGEKAVLVLGGMHGNEPASVKMAQALDKSFAQESKLSNLAVIIVPQVNPDGLARGSRVNARGVDINRNFPSASWGPTAMYGRYNPGTHAASETETQAIINLINSYNPTLIISIHAPFACVNWDGPAEDISQAIAQAAGYPLKRNIGYETPGSLGTYAGIDRKIPTVTLELRAVETDAQIDKNVKALQAIFLCYSDFRAETRQ